MEDRQQQIEAIQTAGEYCGKLINAINNVTEELNGNRKEDTTEYLNTIIEGINWVVQVYNVTQEVLKQFGIEVNKEEVNQAVMLLNQAEQDNDDKKRIEVLNGGLLTFIKCINSAVDKVK